MSSIKSRYLTVAGGHVDALIEYVLDVKPYHTKLSEVVELYEINDNVRVSIKERLNTLAFLGADLLTAAPPAPGVRPRRSNGWWREITSDASRRIWPLPVTAVHRFLSQVSQEKFTAGINDNLQIPGIESHGTAFSPRRWDGPSITNVRRSNQHQQESVDYFLSHGAFSFDVNGTRWKEHNLRSISDFPENDGTLLYPNVSKSFGTVRDIERGDYEEWTLTCVDELNQVVSVVDSSGVFVGFCTMNSEFNHPRIKFYLEEVLELGVPVPMSVGDEFILTPLSKITVNDSAPSETWTLIKVNPIVEMVGGPPTFIDGGNSPAPRQESPALEIHTRSLDRITEASTWAVVFNDDGTYNLSKISAVNPYVIQNIDLRDGCSFKNDDIHFTIIPTADGFYEGDAFNFTLEPEVHNYLVHGSASGWQPSAKTGKWYYNGKIAFKIPKLTYYTERAAGKELNITFVKDVHSMATPSVYTITFQPPANLGDPVRYATVSNNIYGFRRGLELGEVWEDDFCSFIIDQSSPAEYEAGDQIKVFIAHESATVQVFVNAYDSAPYDTQPYDEELEPREVPFSYNQEYFPLYFGYGLVIFKELLTAGEIIIINKALLDVVRFKIQGSTARYPELSAVNDWIPLEFRYFDRPASTAIDYDGKTAHFPDLTTQIEAYLCSNPAAKVFTIVQPRHECTNRSASATLTIDDEFFQTYLGFNTKYELRVQPESNYGQKIRVKVSENLRVFGVFNLIFDDIISVIINDSAISAVQIVGNLELDDELTISFVEGGALPIFFSEVPYDITPYDVPTVIVPKSVQLSPGVFDYTGDDEDWVIPKPTTSVGVYTEQETVDGAGTSFTEGFNVQEFVGGVRDKLNVYYDESKVPEQGLLIDQQASSYIVTHNLNLAVSPTVVLQSVPQFEGDPVVIVSPTINMFLFPGAPTVLSLKSFSFSHPPGFPSVFLLKIT